MLRSSICLACVIVTGCSQAPDSRNQEPAAADIATSENAGPGVSVTAAPGVAFNYQYAFRLPAARIAAAQEAHAAACEKIGVSRCRITGMRYSLTRNNDIDAMLAFKLDPTLARAFGRRGIAAIEAADGMLTNAEITGTDAGAAIARLSADRDRIAHAKAQIERDLARTGLSASARAELVRQRDELDQQQRAGDATTDEQRESLASTPMTFTYESGRAIRGFDARSPLSNAADAGLASAQMTISIAFGAVAVLGPPAILLLLLWLAWRALQKRWASRPAPFGADPAP